MNAIKSIFPQRLVKSLLTAGMFCMGISACADDTAAPEKSFSIADIAELERFYDSYANKRIELPGSGYESGDIVQFIDTGISHNTYTMQYEQTGDGLLVTLPDNLASSEYGIYIVRGGMKFLYGKSYFGRFDSRRLTAGNHPRLLMDSSDFETLKAQLAVADPTSLLARMHTECMVVADAWGMSDSDTGLRARRLGQTHSHRRPGGSPTHFHLRLRLPDHGRHEISGTCGTGHQHSLRFRKLERETAFPRRCRAVGGRGTGLRLALP